MEALFSSNKKLFIIIVAFINISSILLSSQLASASASSEKPYEQASTKFIRTSCSTTTYPRLCYSSLAKHAASIQTNRFILTGTALNVTLASAKSTSALITLLSKNRRLRAREAAAVRDCLEELGDSVNELRRSISEMGLLARSNFQYTMSDVQTWVSAALTDENTCSDGFEDDGGHATDGEVKNVVRAQILTLAHLTSNALAFINQLASVHG